MPIYEYLCEDCQTRYEQLVMSPNTKISCPKCASPRHKLQLSVFSANTKSNGGNGSSFSSSGGCGCTPHSCGCN
jgi:putative FmdB family regulatory protein